MQDLINRWISILNDKDSKENSRLNITSEKRFSFTEGKKYVKITREHSVHAFVDKTTGDVYKPASWAAPAKGVRFNINNDIERILEVCDVYGGYLYRR